MIKTTLFLLVCGCAMVAASCNRNYSCQCSYTTPAGSMESYSDPQGGSKNHALHECSLKRDQLTAEGAKNVECAVPI